jgi:hypothetical protein
MDGVEEIGKLREQIRLTNIKIKFGSERLDKEDMKDHKNNEIRLNLLELYLDEEYEEIINYFYYNFNIY